jgi:hypothetical protein
VHRHLPGRLVGLARLDRFEDGAMFVHLLLLSLGIAQRQFIRQHPQRVVLDLDKVPNDVSQNPVAAALPELSMKAQPQLAQLRVRPTVAYDGLAVVNEGTQTGDIISGSPLRAQAGNRGLNTNPGLDQLLWHAKRNRGGFGASRAVGRLTCAIAAISRSPGSRLPTG